MARRLFAPSLVLALTASWLLVTAVPAAAACHIAGFVESDVTASPDAGVVSLTVELQGRVGSCAGTVDVTTVDGSATAGQDYEAVATTLTFEENDDRVETVDVTILADAAAGSTFTLELSAPTGDISGTSGPATVTITGEGDTAEPDATAEPEVTAEVEDEGGGMLGIALAVLAVVVVGAGAFARLRGRG